MKASVIVALPTEVRQVGSHAEINFTWGLLLLAFLEICMQPFGYKFHISVKWNVLLAPTGGATHPRAALSLL